MAKQTLINHKFSPLQRLYICLAFFTMLAATLWLTNHVIKPTSSIDKRLQITTTECAFSPTTQRIPFAELQWRSCSLPDNWNSTHPNQDGDAWYRMQVSPHGTKDMALYLASFSMNAEAWLNDQYIGSGGSFNEPVARNWNAPLLFDAPTAKLKSSANTITIHIKGYANSSAGLGHVFWGEKEQLHRIFWQHEMLAQGLSYGIFTIAFLLGALCLCLYILMHHVTYLTFALGSLISCFYIADVFMLYIPCSQHVWEIIVHSSILLSQYFFLLFILAVLKLKGQHAIWLKHFGLAHLILSLLLLLSSSNISLLSNALIAHSIGILWLGYVAILLWQYWFKTGLLVVGVFACAVSFELVIFIYDWAPWVWKQELVPPFIFPLGPFAFSLAASLVLLVRFVAANKQEYVFRQELKASLQRQKMKLHDKYAEIAKLEQQQAIHHEQDRITRELHDGLGAHLVGAKALLDDNIQQAKQLIDYSMDELRTLMDSLDSDVDFLSKLGMMRHRLEDRLNAQGIYFDWQVWNIPENMPQNPQTVHHMIRIVQESIHNIEKHAHASNIKVFIDLSGIDIQDNGHGFDVQHAAQGRGLRNIRWRAEQAHAILNIHSNSEGTSVHLYWDAAQASPPKDDT